MRKMPYFASALAQSVALQLVESSDMDEELGVSLVAAAAVVFLVFQSTSGETKSTSKACK